MYRPSLYDSILYFIEIFYRSFVFTYKHKNTLYTCINYAYTNAVKLYKIYRAPRVECPVSKELYEN